MALAGYNTNLGWTAGTTSWTDETCSVIANTSNQDWEIDDSTKDVWDWTQTFTVEVSEDNGSSWSTLNTDEYTLRWLIGVVQLDNLNSGTVTSNDPANVTDVRVDGQSLDQHDVLEGRSGGFTIENTLDDTATRHGDTAPRRIRTGTDVTTTVEELQVKEVPIDGSGGSESSIEDYAENGTTFVYTFNEGASVKSKQRALVKIDDLSHSGASSDGVQIESIDLALTTEDSTMSDQPSADWDIWDY